MPLSKTLRDHIAKVGPLAMGRLTLTAQLLCELQTANVILERHRPNVADKKKNNKGKEDKKKMELLEVIRRRSDKVYEKFLDILTKQGFEESASIFRSGINIFARRMAFLSIIIKATKY